MTLEAHDSPLRLLLVDDDELDRMAVKRLLRQLGRPTQLAETADGLQAVELLLAQHFDCVLMDVHMPAIDGLALLRRIRGLGVDCPVVMLTGQGDEALAVDLMKAGASDYLAKSSLDAARLGAALRGALTLAQAQRAARDAQRLLQQQVQFAEMFVGIASHDLRNPLSVILINATLLERHGGLPPELSACVGRIQNSGQRALRLIRDLLDFTQARLGTGLPLNRTPADLHALLRDAVDELRSTHPARQIVLCLHADGAGAWDADRVTQVVANLVGNALRHGAPDQPVTVTLEGGPDEVCLRVHNRGEPIPAALQAELFRPLRRGDAAAPAGAEAGIGLGLFIVEQIAAAHGGRAGVHSTPEDGTTFSVWLPRAAAAAP